MCHVETHVKSAGYEINDENNEVVGRRRETREREL
jgi:hypothetical protein